MVSIALFPSTSAASKRLFSCASFPETARRANLGWDNLESLIYIRYNLPLLDVPELIKEAHRRHHAATHRQVTDESDIVNVSSISSISSISSSSRISSSSSSSSEDDSDSFSESSSSSSSTSLFSDDDSTTSSASTKRRRKV
jgi:E3 ubiquitin-protein ligase DOA10